MNCDIMLQEDCKMFIDAWKRICHHVFVSYQKISFNGDFQNVQQMFMATKFMNLYHTSQQTFVVIVFDNNDY